MMPANLTSPGSSSVGAGIDPGAVFVHPELAAAALTSGVERELVARALFSTASGGVGWISRRRALELLSACGIQQRSARRVLTDGLGRFWLDDGCGRLWLRAEWRVAAALGVERVRRAHIVPAERLTGPLPGIRATLLACLYAPQDGGRPLSRKLVEQLTGLSERTQRRLESQWGAAEVVAKPVVTVRPAGAYRLDPSESIAGLYVGPRGELLQRLPYIRKAVGHALAGGRRTRRLNRKLAERTGARPPVLTQGQRDPVLRAFFLEREGTTAYLRAPRARGKHSSRHLAPHPLLDHTVIEERTRRGRRRWVAVREAVTDGRE